MLSTLVLLSLGTVAIGRPHCSPNRHHLDTTIRTVPDGSIKSLARASYAPNKTIIVVHNNQICISERIDQSRHSRFFWTVGALSSKLVRFFCFRHASVASCQLASLLSRLRKTRKTQKPNAHQTGGQSELTRVRAGEQLTARPYNSTNECGRRGHREGPISRRLHSVK